MADKSIYPDINTHSAPVSQMPPPTYDAAMGYGPTPTPQHSAPQHMQMPMPYGTNTVHSQVVVTRAPVILGTAPVVGPNPNPLVCPSCRHQIVTRVEYEPGTKTHMIALFLCLFGCWCCPCLPYCINDCKNANHYCPNCGAFIGSHVS